MLCSCAKYRTMTFSHTITDPRGGCTHEDIRGGCIGSVDQIMYGWGTNLYNVHSDVLQSVVHNKF